MSTMMSGVMQWIVLKVLWVFLNCWPFSHYKGRFIRNFGHPENNFLGKFIISKLFQARNAENERLAVAHCHIQPSHQVLEVGFGPGLGLKLAAELISKEAGGMVYGVDISDSMVGQAQVRMQKEIAGSIAELHKASVIEMPFESKKFDRIFHCNVYYFWKERLKCCKELLRVLKPDGYMMTVVRVEGLTTFLTPVQTDVNAYMDDLKTSGFSDVSIETVNLKPGYTFQCIKASYT